MKISRSIPAFVGAGCLAVLLGAPGALAQSADTAGAGGGTASAADKMFVKKAIAGGMGEVEIGPTGRAKG